MKRFKAIAVLAASVVCTAFSSARGDTPLRMDMIASIEARLMLPARAHPLAEYARYYWAVKQSPGMIQGQFLHKTIDKNVGVHIVDEADAPHAQDFGCYLLNVYYDTTSDAPPKVRCGGPG